MSRDGLPRAYLRIDPNIDQVYPELRGTFVGLLCAAGRQPERGRFRNRRLLEGLCGRAYVGRAYARGDLEDLADGRVYVPGWDEWQEGDMTVAERMRRMRSRRTQRAKRNDVTPLPSPERNGVTTDAVVTTTSVSSAGVGVDNLPPPPAKRGRRKDGTNPRAEGTAPRSTGENPRATGESPRQVREAQKRGPTLIGEILRRAAAAGSEG